MTKITKIKYIFLAPQFISLIGLIPSFSSLSIFIFSMVLIAVFAFSIRQTIVGKNKTVLVCAACIALFVSLLFVLMCLVAFLLLSNSNLPHMRPHLIVEIRFDSLILCIGYFSAFVGLIIRYQEIKQLSEPPNPIVLN